ncbi:ATP-binding protein [Kitasatospora sp. NPDC048365]|uniref:ATP-binding protein n=1 Tax=Kitasatospora sp. NPDC048365 TaxID=3364050 RepID=UPI0037235DE7
MSGEPTAYDASTIKILEGPDIVRKRPGMYIGSTGERGLHHLVHELAEPALEENLDGHARRVEITLTPEGSVRVADDGRGIPVEQDGRPTTLEARLTQLWYGGRPFDRQSLSVGHFWVGPAIVNALSIRLTAEVRRDGFHWVQEYERGIALAPPVRTGPTDRTGTTITFRPDPEIFETLDFSFAMLADRFRELAFLNRRLDITLTDERDPAAPASRHFRFPGGLADHLAHPDLIAFERECPEMQGTVEVALHWSDSPDERVTGYANSRPTPGGGTHELGLRDGLAAALPGYSPDRACPGLTAIVSVKLDEPVFEGSIRDRLGNGPVRACVARAVEEHLTAWLDADPDRAAAVLARIAGAR